MLDKHYNIMTSSNDKLLKQIAILLFSINANLGSANVDFYFFHRGIEKDKLFFLQILAKNFDNITLHDVVVEEPEKYDYIAKFGGSWAGEAYYSLCAHQYLPEDVDRILYVDAGDILILDDIAPFYYTDFDGNAIMAANIRRYLPKTVADGNNTFMNLDEPVIFFDENDLLIEEKRKEIFDSTFNSGSYMINIDRMRDCMLTLDDYVGMAEYFVELSGKRENVYFGDQGFLSTCFLGDIKYWGYPECKSLISTPYNFHMGWYNVYEGEFPCKPSIVHFVGQVKPWNLEYGREIPLFKNSEKMRKIEEIKNRQAQWYEIWYQYAKSVELLIGEG